MSRWYFYLFIYSRNLFHNDFSFALFRAKSLKSIQVLNFFFFTFFQTCISLETVPAWVKLKIILIQVQIFLYFSCSLKISSWTSFAVTIYSFLAANSGFFQSFFLFHEETKSVLSFTVSKTTTKKLQLRSSRSVEYFNFVKSW